MRGKERGHETGEEMREQERKGKDAHLQFHYCGGRERAVKWNG